MKLQKNILSKTQEARLYDTECEDTNTKDYRVLTINKSVWSVH